MEYEFPPDVIRPPADVARRSLALFSIMGLAFGAPKPEVTEWLGEADLYSELAPSELRFIEAEAPSEKQIVDAGWMSERLIVLCWALRVVQELPSPDEQCDTGVFQRLLPPFAEVSVEDFIRQAVLRDDRALVAMADQLMTLHGEARRARAKNVSPRTPVDIEIIQERHHAINWVIGYDGASWDEVTADT
jgi:hypothetical protein